MPNLQWYPSSDQKGGRYCYYLTCNTLNAYKSLIATEARNVPGTCRETTNGNNQFSNKKSLNFCKRNPNPHLLSSTIMYH